MFAAATLPPQDPVVQEMLIDLGVIVRKEWDSSFVHGLVIQSMEPLGIIFENKMVYCHHQKINND